MPKHKFFISPQLRQAVTVRAGGICEYCHIRQAHVEYSFHLDHIISLKHDGVTREDNLALTCPDCNFNKGSNLGTYLNPSERVFTPLFHPRSDQWADHFEMVEGFIKPLTPVGEATTRILMFNTIERIILRRELTM